MKSIDNDKRLIDQANRNMCFYDRGRCKKTTRYCAIVASSKSSNILIIGSISQTCLAFTERGKEEEEFTYKGKMRRIVEKTSQNEMTNLLSSLSGFEECNLKRMNLSSPLFLQCPIQHTSKSNWGMLELSNTGRAKHLKQWWFFHYQQELYRLAARRSNRWNVVCNYFTNVH